MRKNYSSRVIGAVTTLFLLACTLGNANKTQAQCPYLEHFTTETNASTSFVSNSQTFTISAVTNGPFAMDAPATVNNLGWDGAANNNYVDNGYSAAPTANLGVSFTISSTTAFQLRGFWLYVSANDYVTLGTSGTITISGDNGGNVFSVSLTSSSWESNAGNHNGFNYIDMATFGGHDNTFKNIKSFTITTSTNSNMDYVAIDGISWTSTSSTQPTSTTGSATVGLVSGGATLNGTINANSLSTNDSFQYSTSSTLASGVTTVVASPATLSTGTSTAISKAITGLTNGTTYYYRVKGSNCNGNTYGSIVSFVPTPASTTITSINRVTSTPANATSVDFLATFGASITTIATSNFSLTTTGVAGASITGISGSGTTRTVTVNTGSGDGTIQLNLANSTSMVPSISTSLPFSGQSYTIDKTAPTVSSVGVPANGTYLAGANLDFTVNWSEAVTVTGTPQIAITLNTGGTVQASYLSGSGTTATVFRYTVVSGNNDPDGISAGTLALNSGTIQDASTNNATLTLNSVGSTTAVLVDAIAPTVSSINRQTPASASTNATTLVYRVTFSESVTGVGISDFTLTATGTAAGSIASVSASSGTTIDVTVNSVSGDGTLRLDLNSSGTGIADVATNAISGGFTSGQTYTLDHTAPSVSSINRQTPAGANTNATTLIYRVAFSESVSGVDISDFALTTTGTAAGTIASVSASSGTIIDVTVNSVTGDGTLRLDLNSSGTGIVDGVSNAISGGYTSGQTYTLDHTAPSVSSINRQTPAGASTNATSLIYRVTFSESVSGVDISDFTLTGTGTAAGTIASVSASSGTTIDVTVNSVSGDGTLRLDLNSSGTGITDAVSNAISGGFTSGQTYTVDHTAPTVSSVSVPSNGNYSTGQNLDFTVNWSESVTVNTGGGTPYIPVTLNTGGTVHASYLSGSGTSALVFRYTVTSGDADPDGIVVGSSITTNGGTLQDGVTNSANLTLNSVGATTGILVNANVAPVFVNGSTQSFSICKNASAFDITSLLHVNDADASQTETWTVSVAGNHGGTLSGFTSNTASSGSTNITPGNTVTYLPANGFSGTETFTIQVSDGVASATSAFTVTVIPLPSVTNAATANTCSGSSPNISLTASASSNFAWTLGTNTGTITGASASSGATINQTLTNPSPSSAGSIVYAVVPTSTVGSCVGAASNITVTVNPLPTITVGTAPSICNGVTSAGLAYTATTNSPDQYSIAWGTAAISRGFSNVSLSSLGSSPQAIATASNPGAGTYTGTITVKNSTTGCSSSATAMSVIVLASPSVSAFGGTPSVMQGATSIYISYNSSSNTPATYSIVYDGTAHTAGFTDVTTASLTSNQIPITLPGGSINGTFSGTLTVQNNIGCSSSASYPISVIIRATPSITIDWGVIVAHGTTSASLSYSGATNTPSTYSIAYNPAALSAGFISVNNASLPANSIPLTIPAGVATGTYSGALTVYNGTSASALYPVIIRVKD